MTWKHGLFLLSLLGCTLHGAGPLDDKGPPYFVDRYGPAKTSKTVSTAVFTDLKHGGVTVKGQFSAREYRQGELRVQPIFILPSLELAAVRLQLNRAWTDEQVEAALKAYGGEWKLVKRGTITHWIAPDGSLAISMLTWLDIHSKAVVDLVSKTSAEAAAKRKAVPTF